MFQKMLSIENAKIRSLLWIELGVMSMLLLIEFTEMLFMGLANEIELWPGSLFSTIKTMYYFGSFPLIVLAGAITTQEYTWRTMRLWLCRGVSRSTLSLAKIAALFSAAIPIILVPFLVKGAATGILTLIMDGNLHIRQLTLVRLSTTALSTFWALLPYAGLAFLLGIVTRSTTVTVTGGVVYALFENLLVGKLVMMGGTWAKIAACLPKALGLSLLLPPESLKSVSLVGESGIPFLEPVPATLGIAFWVIFSVVAALLVFRRQDLAG